MKSMNEDLRRLLGAAAVAPGRPLVELDSGLQNRVLARLRSSRVASRISALSELWWRGALAACALAVVAVSLALWQSSPELPDPYAEAETLPVESYGLAAN